MKRNKGFTLVELVIVIAIVIVLSVVSVPIYRSYVEKAKMTEGYALLGTILSAQKAYYSEYGYFYWSPNNKDYDWSSYYPALGVDARGNKYFTAFYTDSNPSTAKNSFWAGAEKPKELLDNGKTRLGLRYIITSGITLYEGGQIVEEN